MVSLKDKKPSEVLYSVQCGGGGESHHETW